MYEAIAAWHGKYASAAHHSISLAASLADQCAYMELCGCAAAERAEHQQQQAHRNHAKLLEHPGTGRDAVHVAHTCALSKYNCKFAMEFLLVPKVLAPVLAGFQACHTARLVMVS